MRYADFSGGQDLRGARFSSSWLDHATFAQSDLPYAWLDYSSLTGANLTTAWLGNANLSDALLQSAVFDSTRYNQWALFPDGFDPVAMGLTFVLSEDDFDADHVLGTSDINMLTTKIGHGSVEPAWLPDSAFDLNNDDAIDLEDRRIWVREVKNTWYGDVNLDGEFDSSDSVMMFVVGVSTDLRAGLPRGITHSWQELDSREHCHVSQQIPPVAAVFDVRHVLVHDVAGRDFTFLPIGAFQLERNRYCRCSRWRCARGMERQFETGRYAAGGEVWDP